MLYPSHTIREGIVDQYWVERKVVDIVLECIKLSFENKNFKLVQEMLNDILSVIKLLSGNHEIGLAIEIIERIEEIIFNKNIISSHDNDTVTLAIFDLIGCMRSEILVSLFVCVKDLSVMKTKEVVKSIKWGDDKSLYLSSLPSIVKKDLLDLSRKIKFEQDIEGYRVTPDWYIEKVVWESYMGMIRKNLDMSFEFTINNIRKVKGKNIYSLIEENSKQSVVILPLFERMLEHLRKIDLLLDASIKFFKEVDNENIKDGPWERPSISQNKINSWKSDLIYELSCIAVKFKGNDYSGQMPDYKGRFIHFIGHYILDSFMRYKIFKREMFNNFFSGSLGILLDLGNVDPGPSEIKIAESPILDLISISGLMFILSEFHEEPDVWNAIMQRWDSRLDSNLERVLDALQAVLGNQDMLFRHRSNYRHSCALRVVRFLKEKLRDTDCESSYVQSFVKYELLGFLGEDVFIDIYLLKKSKEIQGKEFKFSSRQNRFLDYVNNHSL